MSKFTVNFPIIAEEVCSKKDNSIFYLWAVENIRVGGSGPKHIMDQKGIERISSSWSITIVMINNSILSNFDRYTMVIYIMGDTNHNLHEHLRPVMVNYL